jgi:hypothetical protein
VSKQVPIKNGVLICPRGHVLILDAESSSYTGAFGAARLGECVFCRQGTYSINPLYGGSGPETKQNVSSSNCLICPAAGTCPGGDQVTDCNQHAQQHRTPSTTNTLHHTLYQVQQNCMTMHLQLSSFLVTQNKTISFFSDHGFHFSDINRHISLPSNTSAVL